MGVVALLVALDDNVGGTVDVYEDDDPLNDHDDVVGNEADKDVVDEPPPLNFPNCPDYPHFHLSHSSPPKNALVVYEAVLVSLHSQSRKLLTKLLPVR